MDSDLIEGRQAKNRKRGTTTQAEETSLDFVASHYRHGAFNAHRDWKELNIPGQSWLRRHAAAAAMWGVALTACAAITAWMLTPSTPSAPASSTPIPEVTPVAAPLSPEKVSRRIEFTDASLQEVAGAVQEVYGVTLANLPTESAQRITLSYEGTAEELVETLNSLLDANIIISSTTLPLSSPESKTEQ